MKITLNEKGNYQVASSSLAVSYLDDGRQVVLHADPACALVCDAEIVRAPRDFIVNKLSNSSDPLDFTKAWTRLEVIAKINNIPVLKLLKDPEISTYLETSLIKTTTIENDTIVVSWSRTIGEISLQCQ